MEFRKIGFIGFGLIGGSVAHAIRNYHPETHIIAYSRTRATLVDACRAGVVNEIRDQIDEGFADCDMIFLCAPVSVNISVLPVLKDLVKDTCIITDVGSTKTAIHEEVTKLGMEKLFIGGHPMAGSEKTGFANSGRLLLENAYYILTPTSETDPAVLADMAAYIGSLKPIVLTLPYEKHDHVTATISHLPHLIAAALVNLVHDLDVSDERHTMKTVAAGGFKDITRIASSSPEMWEAICTTNADKILEVLDGYISSLEDIRGMLKDRDGKSINKLFADSREYRNSFAERSSGPIKKEHVLYCDLKDETGGIARLTTILANKAINLKNIGIVNNRIFEEAVLRVEFYDEKACEKAVEILREFGYTVYTR